MSRKYFYYSLPLLIFSNLMPIYGVVHYGWTLFSVIYLYWLELLFITFFDALKIWMAQGKPMPTSTKIFIGIKFILARIGIFCFYLIFLITFIGVLMSAKESRTDEMIQMVQALTLKGTFYKITALSFFANGLYNFYVSYYLPQKYKTQDADATYSFLDIHILVVHVSVVLIVFLHKGLTEKLHLEHQTSIILCTCLFVFIKVFAESIKSYSADKSLDEKQRDIYI
ncbi:MAG: DUF6498-containing protein [Chitinophagales bacterium]|nr:hypothetical protein [Bacteroidota bacterium]